MALWICVAVVGWASFQVGRWIAMWFRPRVEGARASPVSSTRVVALFIVIAAIGFGAWNQRAKVYPLSMLHAGILAACMMFGYQSVQGRQGSLQSDINSLAQGVSDAIARPLGSQERLKSLLAVAMQNDVIASKVRIGFFVEGTDGRPRGSLKMVGDTLIDDPANLNGITTSTEEKIDLMLQEIGFAILAKFGEDVMPKRHKQNLSERDLRNLKESSDRTRALLDDSYIDWEHVNDAVFHISEARLRRGIEAADLTAMEKRIRSERPRG